MLHYEPIKVTINIQRLTEVIIDVVIQYHGLSDSIISDCGAIFTSKFWSLFCYFLDIKKQLSTTFYPQINRQTEGQKSIIETYLWAFINFEQNDWPKLLPIAEFAYNNGKNTRTGHTPFELNHGYHPQMS